MPCPSCSHCPNLAIPLLPHAHTQLLLSAASWDAQLPPAVKLRSLKALKRVLQGLGSKRFVIEAPQQAMGTPMALPGELGRRVWVGVPGATYRALWTLQCRMLDVCAVVGVIPYRCAKAVDRQTVVAVLLALNAASCFAQSLRFPHTLISHHRQHSLRRTRRPGGAVAAHHRRAGAVQDAAQRLLRAAARPDHAARGGLHRSHRRGLGRGGALRCGRRGVPAGQQRRRGSKPSAGSCPWKTA